ncbi:MAG: hypothetical protein KQH53_11055 [Desulfarculaceae bacterium]|nr:hypothetical protein [Desulfarculaceae bacterium]
MTFFSLRWLLPSLGLFCLGGLLLLTACSGDEPANPKAVEFVKMVNADLAQAEKHLQSPNEEKNLTALSQGLAKLFKDAADRGKPLTHAVVVLSDQGKSLAARVPEAGHPEGVAKENNELDYSRYDKVQALINNRGTGSFVFYAPMGELYVVCRPFKAGGPRVGGLCVGYDGALIKKKLGLDKEQFEALDFNS